MRCVWCKGKVAPLARPGALGGRYFHTETRKEACPDGVTIADPPVHDPLKKGRKRTPANA